ncbi:MAG: hypothetical protein EBS71_06325 [Actinobacteria bacterium]|nr:hypothetical protein [Actinomycetota bacterium]
MGQRFRYSRWDGTQRGFDLDADALLNQINDEIIHHGDVNAALRRIMQQGMRDRNGEQVQGLREALERLRERRRELREQGQFDGELGELAAELADIVDEERLAIDQDEQRATESGDERRSEIARDAAARRRLQLDALPDNLAQRIDSLRHHDFQSPDAQRRFEQLVDRLRQQLLDQHVQQVSSAVENMTPEQMARMKDMMAALNAMLERHERGEDPQFEQFMNEFGDFFPENPQTLDELLELMARRMAAARALYNSMSPEQRAQMQALSDQLLEDMDLRWQIDQLGERLQAAFPNLGWDDDSGLEGDTPMPFGDALRAAQDLHDLDELERFLRDASSPAALREVDLDKVRQLLGDVTAESIDHLARLTDTLREAGLIDQREGRTELTPRALRAVGKNALNELFGRLERDTLGQHRIERTGSGHERAHETKGYEYGDPFHLDLQQTLRNALRRQGGGLPLRLSPEDRAVRISSLFDPYHAAIREQALRLKQAMGGDGAPVILSIHSFTPIMDAVERPWEIGILWNRDPRLPEPLIAGDSLQRKRRMACPRQRRRKFKKTMLLWLPLKKLMRKSLQSRTERPSSA